MDRTGLRGIWRRARWHVRWSLSKAPWIITYHDVIKINLVNSGSSALLYYHGHSEPEICALLERTLRPGDVFFDIGAHIGEHSLAAARLVGKKGEVHSFEPNPTLAAALKASVEVNAYDNVVVNQLAVSDRSSPNRLTVTIDPSYSFLGSTVTEVVLDKNGTASRTLLVEAVSLDEYWGSSRKLDLLKIDVEGGEMNVLQGAQALLSRPRGDAPSIVLEYHPMTYDRYGFTLTHLVSLLESFGYRAWEIVSGGLLRPLDLASQTGKAAALAATKGRDLDLDVSLSNASGPC